MPAIIVPNSSLFDSPAKYIVHQCNCVTWTPAHLAKDMFANFPYANIYAPRKLTGHRDTPGDIVIKGNGQDQRYIIAIFGQIYPGKPRSTIPGDSFEYRTKFFFSGLKKIAEIKDLDSVAFPDHIGCGAAGNDWDTYHKLIDKFADYIAGRAKVYICQL